MHFSIEMVALAESNWKKTDRHVLWTFNEAEMKGKYFSVCISGWFDKEK